MFDALLAQDASPAARWLRRKGVRRAVHLAALFREAELADGSVLARLAAEENLEDEADLERAEGDLKRLIDIARVQVGVERDRFVQTPTWTLAAQADVRRRREDDERDAAEREARLAKAAGARRPPPPRNPRFATSRARAAAGDGAHAREQAERAAKDKWVEELVRIMLEVNAPSLTALGDSTNPLQLFRLTLRGKRASTLRARVREWRRFTAWLLRVKGRAWPRLPTDILDYGMERLDEPCTKSSLKNFWSTVGFMERHAGIREPFSDNEMVKVGVYAMIAEARARLDGGDRKQALPPPVRLVCALEDAIMDADRADLERALAWWMCASVWCSFRFDDHRGLPPSRIQETNSGYEFVLDRSKTTGPDKAVTLRHGIIAQEAFLKQEKWAKTGLEIWKRIAPFERDFFLCRPNGEGGCIPVELQYMEYSGMMRYLLTTISIGPESFSLGEEVTQCFSPHSFRAFLPSCLKALGAPETEQAWMSAWQAKGSDIYVRTGRSRAIQMQTRLAQIIKEQTLRGDPIGERDVLDKLESALTSRGAEQEEVQACLEALTNYRDADAETPTWTSVSAADVTTRPKEGSVATSSSSSTHRRKAEITQTTSSKASRTGDKDSPEDSASLDKESGYVIATSTKTKRRTLHCLGQCFRKPGVHYGRYEIKGNTLPSNTEYDTYCRACWKGESAPQAPDPAESSRSSSCATSDESSSTEAD